MANYYCCVPESAQCTEVPQYVCQMEEETRCTYPKDYKDEYCPPRVSINFMKFEKNQKIPTKILSQLDWLSRKLRVSVNNELNFFFHFSVA